MQFGEILSMIESQDIKEEINNVNGQKFLRFKDKIVNLSHVIEVEAKHESEERQIICFKYSDGSTYTEKYEDSVMFTKDSGIIHHCIAKGLFAVVLTKECHVRWAEYSNEHGEMVHELNQRYSGSSDR